MKNKPPKCAILKPIIIGRVSNMGLDNESNSISEMSDPEFDEILRELQRLSEESEPNDS